MKKECARKTRITKKMLAAAIVLAVFLALLPAAYAAPFKGTVGENCWFVVDSGQSDEDYADTVTIVDGYLPSGLSIVKNQDYTIISGVPTEYGTFSISGKTFHQLSNGWQSWTAEITINPGSKTLSAVTKTAVVGTGFSLELDISTGGEIFDAKISSGTLPDGLSFASYDSYVTISGKPTSAGTYKFTVTALDDHSGCNISQPVTITVSEAASIATPTPSPAKPTITKHPTGETVVEGESAVFVSRADNADEIIWRLVSADTKTTYECKDAPNYFKGLTVTGLNTERLTLGNIPLELNGWKVEAKFVSKGGNAWSNGALLTVKKAELKVPTITSQPQGRELEKGSSAELSIKAVSPDNNTLVYQWYRNISNSTSGGEAIPGATSASYTPDYFDGNMYYYCAVRNTKGDDTSTTVYSDVAVVRYLPEASPEPSQEPSPDPSSEPSQEPSPEPTETPAQSGKTSGLLIAILVALIVLIAALAAVAIILIKQKKGRH